MLKQTVTWILFSAILHYNTVIMAKSAKIPPTFVESITVTGNDHQEQISATGSLISIPGIVVKPEISGRITKVYFKSGDAVAAGAPLVEINTDVIKAGLADAMAQSSLAKAQFGRATELYKTKDISKDAFERAKASIASAQAKLENMQAQLRQANIIAPFTGKLGLSQVSVGDYVNAGQSVLVNLQSMDPLSVDFSIPENYLSKVAIGQTVLLRTDAYPKEIFTGTVEAIESLINQKNRTLSIRASVPNKDGRLLPGAFVETTLQLSKQQKLIMVPQTAVVYSPSGNYVFKIINNKAQKAPVTIGERDSNNIIIKSGVNIGDAIITAGQLKIGDGSPVIIVGNNKK